MKNIYEILSGLNLEIPEGKKSDFEKDLFANYKTVADYDKQVGKVAQLTDQLKSTTDGLKAFEGVDVNELKGRIIKLQGDLARQESDYQAKIADMAFESLLSSAVTAAKGRDAKAVCSMLDIDALKNSKNQEADIRAAMDQLKKDKSYLFEADRTPPPYAAGTGTQKMTGAVTKESFARMGYRERLELKQNNPKLYEQVKE
ncbi:phage scaffolding protein [Clostridiaceae bacterium NSJ-31]|uniref:Phage scaffolding protein n=1 Tax=Ligaoa zhengdingensis TaxID=2763658 RepID=A0A926I478_9FIRM|nr:phage scaffolding protein [Ligaoa zhengdingensis]MBC8546110.1 phage scaffolding protein [Ligaoa zhengdingensis]